MPVRPRVGNTTPGTICTRWLQARRARSDAPYRVGLAISLLDFMAHFGVRVDGILAGTAPRGSCARRATCQIMYGWLASSRRTLLCRKRNRCRPPKHRPRCGCGSLSSNWFKAPAIAAPPIVMNSANGETPTTTRNCMATSRFWADCPPK